MQTTRQEILEALVNVEQDLLLKYQGQIQALDGILDYLTGE